MTEKQLYRAFEFQRFSPNPRLQAVIDGVHARMAARELDDAELDYVAAAGPMTPLKEFQEPRS